MFRIIVGILIGISFSLSSNHTNTYAPNTNPSYDQSVYYVNNDRGGVITFYYSMMEALDYSETKVVIDGLCASACTMYATLDNVCITPNATMGFHGSYRRNVETGEIDYSDESVMVSEIVNFNMQDQLPAGIKNYLEQNYVPSVYNGDDTNDILVVGYDILKKFIKTC